MRDVWQDGEEPKQIQGKSENRRVFTPLARSSYRFVSRKNRRNSCATLSRQPDCSKTKPAMLRERYALLAAHEPQWDRWPRLRVVLSHTRQAVLPISAERVREPGRSVMLILVSKSSSVDSTGSSGVDTLACSVVNGVVRS